MLEIIWFPGTKVIRSGNAPGRDRRQFLGIDHTAIVVSDTDRNLKVLSRSTGLPRRVGATYGTEQEHLNQNLRRTPAHHGVEPERGPGIEFLEYIAPPGGRDLPADAKANDLVFWNTQLVVDDLPAITSAHRASGGRFVSPGA